MRSAWLVILPLFLGCAGKNTVAGNDKTKAEQLETSVPSWCQTTCEKIVACADATDCACSGDVCDCSNANVPDCVDSCKGELARFTQGSDACAAAGESFKTCIDGMQCRDFTSNTGKDCDPSAADEAACPELDDNSPDGDSPPISGTGGSVNYGAGGTISSGTAGSVNYGAGGTGIGGYGGSTTTGVAVSCQESYGTGGTTGTAGSAATSAVTCEEGRNDCSDGHDYAWLCARGSDDKIGCACFVDGAATGGFDPQSEVCPTLDRVNIGCGFGLIN
jgi:hypothetical protein